MKGISLMRCHTQKLAKICFSHRKHVLFDSPKGLEGCGRHASGTSSVATTTTYHADNPGSSQPTHHPLVSLYSRFGSIAASEGLI